MRARTLAAMLACAAIAAAAHRLEADTLEAVKKRIHERASRLKTLSYAIKMTDEVSVQGNTIKIELDIKFEYKRKGDKVLSRTDKKTVQDMGDGRKMSGTNLVIYDGQFTYMYSDTMGNKTAVKILPGPESKVSPLDPEAAFKRNDELYELKLLPDEKVNGEDCYVIEMIMKDEEKRKIAGKTISYFSKKTGLTVKAATHDPSGKPTSITVMSDCKIDTAISDDRFVFKAPSGVKVSDMTKTPTPGG